SESGSGGACADGFGLTGARGVAVSPDGKNVYVAADTTGSLAIFSRDQATGAVTEQACLNGDASDGCTLATAIRGARDVEVSPDGTTVYVAAEDAPAVDIFKRDPVTGGLTQLPGTAGCISKDGTSGNCGTDALLTQVRSVAISPDLRNVYVASL